MFVVWMGTGSAILAGRVESKHGSKTPILVLESSTTRTGPFRVRDSVVVYSLYSRNPLPTTLHIAPAPPYFEVVKSKNMHNRFKYGYQQTEHTEKTLLRWLKLDVEADGQIFVVIQHAMSQWSQLLQNVVSD